MAFYTPDPEHVYINISTSAGISTTTASVDPVAVFREKRNVPIISDCSKYRLAIARCDINGCRTLPLFIPSIQPGQSDPFKTAYAIALSTYVYNSDQSLPPWQLPTVADAPVYLHVTTIDPSNQVKKIAQANVYYPSGGLIPNLASWVTSINAAFAAIDAVNDGGCMKALTCSEDNGFLKFMVASGFPGWTFTIDLFGRNGNPDRGVGYDYTANTAASWFGMPNLPSETWGQLGSGGKNLNPSPWVQRSDSLGVLVTPNLPFSTYTSLITATSGSVNLQWVPQTSGLLAPRPPIPGQVESTAYWTYDYEWFVGIFNTAMKQAYSQLILSASAQGYTVTTVAPLLQYVPSSKSFSLYMDSGCTSSVWNPKSADNAEELSVSFNEPLQNLLMLPASYDPYGNVILNTSNAAFVSGAPIVGATKDWVVLTNDFSPVASLWSPIGSLVFGTQFFPVRSEVSSAPQIYGIGDVGQGSQVDTASDSTQLLSDVIPNIVDASDWRAQTTLYNPTVLRWVDMPSGSFPLDTIDFQLGWRNARTGTITPLTLNPLASFSVKILLRRKDVLD